MLPLAPLAEPLAPPSGAPEPAMLIVAPAWLAAPALVLPPFVELAPAMPFGRGPLGALLVPQARNGVSRASQTAADARISAEASRGHRRGEDHFWSQAWPFQCTARSIGKIS